MVVLTETEENMTPEDMEAYYGMSAANDRRDKTLRDELAALKAENERRKELYIAYVYQCEKLAADKAELLEALNDMVESYQYEAAMENPTLLKAKEVLSKHDTQRPN